MRSRAAEPRDRRRCNRLGMRVVKPALCAAVVVTVAATFAGIGDREAASARARTPSGGERPLPPPVQVRPEPEVALGDPAFEPLPGARADFGRLGGSVYQIEVP